MISRNAGNGEFYGRYPAYGAMVSTQNFKSCERCANKGLHPALPASDPRARVTAPVSVTGKSRLRVAWGSVWGWACRR